jgi:hypothetical protein
MKKALPSLASWPILIAFAIVASIGLAIHYENSRPEQNDQPKTQSGNWQKVTTQQAVFTTQIFLARDLTYVLIPIKFDSNPQTIWLNFDATPSAQPAQLLVTHPHLSQLESWNHIAEKTIHLYQKEKTYTTLDEFIKNPPRQNVILADPAIIALSRFSSLRTTPLSENTTLEGIEYVLTTFTNPQFKEGAYWYENTVDASYGVISDKNSLAWGLLAPNVSETNPYYLGEIHVDYQRQAR